MQEEKNLSELVLSQSLSKKTSGQPGYPGLTVIIPAYNEEKSISEVISKLNNTMTKSGLKYELIVVDDGSTDDTSKQVISKEATLVSHHFNKGYGAALKTGIKHAKYNTIIIKTLLFLYA